MVHIPQIIATELSLPLNSINNALSLFGEGATIPFIARYRKERTGSLDETQLRDIQERFLYLEELQARKQVILETIASQGKLTPELEKKIVTTLQKTELEDLYLPYKPKRRTKATIAKEQGLQPLAETIKKWNHPQTKSISLEEEADKYLTSDITDREQALKGASDILAEEIAEIAEVRAYLRDYLLQQGLFTSKIKKDHPEGTTKFEMYRQFERKLTTIPSHNVLALFRGEKEKVLTVDIAFDETDVSWYLEKQIIKSKIPALKKFYQQMLQDCFSRLLKPALVREVRAEKKALADLESIQTFEANLRELLLSAPAGMKPTLAIDPGFRTGCKVAVLSQTGTFLEYQAIFPHTGNQKRELATKAVEQLIAKYNIELIAIGNGTASRETDQFITDVLKKIKNKPTKVIVNESGASIYSASKVAIAEFPDLDVTVRGAISIGRRLQDPLAELVKIDPKSIGVGQYQHDVDQKLLKKKLEDTVESCVNYVGVDLNTASSQLLTFVSGINKTIANNIVAYRNELGAFKNRKQLLKVKKLGKKTFELAAGFLRIRDGDNPLDNTAVHPESYAVVKNISSSLKIPLNDIDRISSRLSTLDLNQYVNETIGLPTLEDIVQELEKPGRDPRAEFQYATFKEGITEITDLKMGMELEGIVTNVVNFGAFVDVGVHQDGLVHISQLADRFVSDPNEIVKVGQVVKVRVLEVDEKLRRIGLSMKDARN